MPAATRPRFTFDRAVPVLVPALLAMLVAAFLVGEDAAYLHEYSRQSAPSASGWSSPGSPFLPPTHPGAYPSYTVADVRAFLAKTLPSDRAFGNVTATGKPWTVVRIAFITQDEATTLMRGGAERDGDLSAGGGGRLLCSIQLYGPFLLIGHSLGISLRTNGDPEKLQPVATVYAILDAGTGNLLVWGAHP
jgi:hypothetical protein